MRMRIVIVVVGAALALGACSGRYGTVPARRPGLWQETFAHDGKTNQLGALRSVRVCVDAGTEARSPIFSYDAALKHAQARHCQPPVANRGLDGAYNFSSTCPLADGDGTMVTKGTGSGDFKTTYHLHLESTVTYQPPFTPMNSHHLTDIDGVWQGVCPSSMRPGDMMLANGAIAPGGGIKDPHAGLRMRGRP